MKITLELNDILFEEIKRYTSEYQTTLQEVLESALRSFLQQQGTNKISFQMRRATFPGNGLHVEIQQGNWSRIRSQIYEGQGG